MTDAKDKIADGETLAEMWDGFTEMTMPIVRKDSVQYSEMRNAFYAGALCLFNSLMVHVEPGDEPTANDMARMETLNDELLAFMAEVEARKPRGTA